MKILVSKYTFSADRYVPKGYFMSIPEDGGDLICGKWDEARDFKTLSRAKRIINTLRLNSQYSSYNFRIVEE